MYWRKKKFDYAILIPPLEKPFEEFTPEEAKNYFNWHMSQLDARKEYLQQYSRVNLDYSVESLDAVWGWFLERAEIEKTPQARLQAIKKERENEPKEIVKEILKAASKQFSLETEYILRDIAMYFGEVCVRNNASISWGYHTDTTLDSFANMPVLVGFEDRDVDPPFKTHFDPFWSVDEVASYRLDDDSSEKDLSELYRKWQRLIHND